MNDHENKLKISGYSIQPIVFGTPAFDESVDLRNRLLRIPLGIEFTAEQISQEWDSHHIGMYDPLGVLRACLILKPLDNDNWKMRQVAVDESCQGRGLGTELVKYSEEFCKRHGVIKIVLHARENALKFYTRLSYTIYGEPFEEVGIPHRSMYKELSSDADGQ